MSNQKPYVDQVNDWLNADPATRTIEEGAKLMLQGNKNRILHENVIHRSNFEKVVYELEKIIGDKRVVTEPINIPALEEKVAKIELLPAREGKRADHDFLPLEIQSIPERNTAIYHQMRSYFERLKVLSEDGHTAEERFPILAELLELDAQLTANWQTYDNFDVNAPKEQDRKPAAAAGEKIDAKRVSANRKYLSDNKTKLPVLITEGKTDKAEKLLAEMQLRYNELILNGDTFAPDQVAELKALGLIVGTTEEAKEEPVSETQIKPEGEETIAPAVTSTEETPEENVIGQIKTLLNNNITKEVIIPTILSLGKFGELELTPEVVEDLYNKAVEQEMNAVE